MDSIGLDEHRQTTSDQAGLVSSEGRGGGCDDSATGVQEIGCGGFDEIAIADQDIRDGGMLFGDYCLMCGELMDGDGGAGYAYCSEECELSERMGSEVEWWDMSLEGFPRHSGRGCSTGASSMTTSAPGSPGAFASDRLAILCSGGATCEGMMPLELGKQLLGGDLDGDGWEAWSSEPPMSLSGHPHTLATLPELAPPPSSSIKASPSVAALSNLSSLDGLTERSSLLHTRSASICSPYLSRLTPTCALTSPRRVSEPIITPITTTALLHSAYWKGSTQPNCVWSRPIGIRPARHQPSRFCERGKAIQGEQDDHTNEEKIARLGILNDNQQEEGDDNQQVRQAVPIPIES